MLTLTNNQNQALRSLLAWHKDKDKDPFITLGGYAGTGKTTLISYFRHELDKKKPDIRVAFCAYTGKAARVLQHKLRDLQCIYHKDRISTIHALIYSPITNDREEITGWKKKDKDELKYDLIIVDEASMIDMDIWRDLQSFDIPIIAVGDHGQLPPIRGKFSLMQSPQLRLEEIHRQARDNPIIDLSILARETGIIPAGKLSSTVMKVLRSDEDTMNTIGDVLERYDEDMLVLTGYNHTRVKLNKHLRNVKEKLSLLPEPGDRVICLRNNHEKEVFNGMTGTLIHIDEDDKDWSYAEIEMDGETRVYEGLIYLHQFGNPESFNFTSNRKLVMKGDLFDFGYALTVHKAQGSQAKRVVLFEERFSKMSEDDWKRWLYTAVTRAEEELYIIGKG